MTSTKKINIWIKTTIQGKWQIYAFECEALEAFTSAKNLIENGFEVKMENCK